MGCCKNSQTYNIWYITYCVIYYILRLDIILQQTRHNFFCIVIFLLIKRNLILKNKITFLPFLSCGYHHIFNFTVINESGNIENYSETFYNNPEYATGGSAEQNTKLLSLLKQGKLIK